MKKSTKNTKGRSTDVSDEDLRKLGKPPKETVMWIQKPDRPIPVDETLIGEEMNLLCCLLGVDKETLNGSVKASLTYSLERLYKMAYAVGDDDRDSKGPVKGRMVLYGTVPSSPSINSGDTANLDSITRTFAPNKQC